MTKQLSFKPCTTPDAKCSTVRGLSAHGREIRCPHPPTTSIGKLHLCQQCLQKYINDEVFREGINSRLVEDHLETSDFHTKTAAEYYKVAPEDVTPAMRNAQKTRNFLALYGKGSS